MRILVTGGAGYIGSALIPMLLTEGHEVTVVDSMLFSDSALLACCSFQQFTFLRGDILNEEFMAPLIKEHDTIIWLAALVGAPVCKANPDLATAVNLDSISALMSHVNDEQLLLFPNTNSGYGIGDRDEMCTENSPLNPISHYGKLKVAAEKLVLSRQKSIVFRFATVFGVSPRLRLDLLVNDFTYQAFKNRTLVLFEENFRRNFIHVSDAAGAFLFAIKNSERMCGHAFNVGLSSANLTKRELAEQIKSHVPSLYIHSAEYGEDPDKRDYVVSNEKIESLGWAPRKSLDDGIEELLKAFEMLSPGNYKNI